PKKLPLGPTSPSPTSTTPPDTNITQTNTSSPLTFEIDLTSHQIPPTHLSFSSSSLPHPASTNVSTPHLKSYSKATCSTSIRCYVTLPEANSHALHPQPLPLPLLFLSWSLLDPTHHQLQLLSIPWSPVLKQVT
ncbi:unnamed protein product, partial [Dovyalis caffra]